MNFVFTVQIMFHFHANPIEITIFLPVSPSLKDALLLKTFVFKFVLKYSGGGVLKHAYYYVHEKKKQLQTFIDSFCCDIDCDEQILMIVIV